MKKALLMAAVVGMILGSTAMAQESTLFFDIRGTHAEITAPTYPHTNGYGSGAGFNYGGPDNLGMEGDGQMLWITPTHADGFETAPQVMNSWPSNNDGDQNTSTGDLYLYMTVNEDTDTIPGTNDVISSLGLDFGLTDDGLGGHNRLADLGFAWEAFLDNGGNAQTAAGANDGGDPPSWNDAKMVKVPVDATPLYAVGAGMVPTNTYKVGTLSATGGLRECVFVPTHRNDSTFNVHISVDGLLITRTFETGGDVPGAEWVSFGYNAGAPETAVNGSLEFATSTEPDAIIVVQMIGDGSGDGRVLGNDIGPFVQAKNATLTDTQTCVMPAIYDNTGDRKILGNDIGGFVFAKNGSAVCP